jgi:hypothetical protein
MKALIAILLSLLIGPFASAAPAAYLDMGESFFSKPVLIVDGKSYEASGWDGSFPLTEAFQHHPQALRYAELHESAAMHATLGIWGGTAIALTYLFSTPYKDVNLGVYWGIFAVGLIYGISNGKLAQSYAFKAINAYNGVDTTKPSTSFEIRPRLTPGEKRLSLNLVDFSF